MGKQAGHAARIVVIFAKLATQECFLRANDWKVNDSEQQNDRQEDPHVARGNSKSNPDDDGAEIQRIAHVSVGAVHGEHEVLLHVPRSDGTKQNSQQRNRGADQEREPCRPCSPEIECRKGEPERYADAPGNSTPRRWRLAGLRLRHRGLPAVGPPPRSPTEARSTSAL